MAIFWDCIAILCLDIGKIKCSQFILCIGVVFISYLVCLYNCSKSTKLFCYYFNKNLVKNVINGYKLAFKNTYVESLDNGTYLLKIRSKTNPSFWKRSASKSSGVPTYKLMNKERRNWVCNWEGCETAMTPDIVRKLKQCGACQTVAYCSRECQKSDWKEHKKVCVGKGGGKK